VVDDDEQSCIALRSLVESAPGFRFLGRYRTLESARAGILDLNPSIVLMNLLLPDGCGIEFTRFLKREFPQIVVVMATGFDLEEAMAGSLAAGASGYLAKPIHPGQFLATLRFALGRHPVPGLDCPIPANRPGSPAGVRPRLTDREQAVLALLSDGLLYKEIAARLGVSVPVVHKLLHRTYRKLKASNRTEAIKHWLGQINPADFAFDTNLEFHRQVAGKMS